MKQTLETVFIGGFLSSEYQVNMVSERLSEYMDEEVKGMSFRSARQDRERRADFINGKNLITHSAGSMVMNDTQPARVLAIAPPIITPVGALLSRTANIVRTEISGGRRSRSAAVMATRLGASSADEMLRHLSENSRAIPAIAQFSSVEVGSRLAQAGVPTKLVFMESDEFFSPQTMAFQRQLARAAFELDIVSIDGHHCDFAKNPALVLGKIAAAEAIECASLTGATVESPPQSLALAPA